MSTPQILEGWVSVLAALQAGRRPVQAVYLQAGKPVRQAGQITAAARQRGLQVQSIPAEQLDALAQGRSHGGVLAQAGERSFQTLEELTAAAPQGFFAMLYGVEDPYNYGQAVRALYAAGADGLVVPQRNWDTALNVVARASAGATEYMPTAQAAPETAIQHFKAQGCLVAATAKARTATPLYAADLRGPLFLLIGGERRGLGAAAQALCDLQITIPYGRGFAGELDVTSSTAALAFEVMRQRQG
ncbi:MAG: RNA methyltransferase [Anaerolineales bacterium]|nr:RNA methyltransferase [Anaerolineales bacterium]MCW5855786.1 RNA methyltransferase [Anaerolineales bacterium]